MNQLQLEQLLNEKLSPELIKDYCPNGLQIEGRPEVKKIITGVTASKALIDKAIELEADAILVHHGYFWKGEPQAIRGMKGARIKALIQNDINLYGYHLPLDIHPELGNNAKLAELLGISVEGGWSQHHNLLLFTAHLSNQSAVQSFRNVLKKRSTVNLCTSHQKPISQ